MNPDSPYLSVIIPAYNEENRIIPTLEKIAGYLKSQNYSYEVIVVDDGSTDFTVSKVNQFASQNPSFAVLSLNENSGKGAAVKAGMLAANGEVRLFSDADLSTPIEDLKNLLAQVDEFDVVIGSRRLAGSILSKRQPFYREFAGRVFSLLVRLIALPGFLDTQCGFKLFKGHAAEKVFKDVQTFGFGFDVEVLALAVRRHKLKVKETPVRWHNSTQTKVNLVRDSLAMFVDLFRIRIRI